VTRAEQKDRCRNAAIDDAGDMAGDWARRVWERLKHDMEGATASDRTGLLMLMSTAYCVHCGAKHGGCHRCQCDDCEQ